MPFLLSIAYVALHHGVAGSLDPASVFNHEAAIAHPWRWAGVHAFFIAGISAAEVVHWRLSENARAETDAVLRSAGDGIFGVDTHGRITFANPAAQRMAGGDEGTLQGCDLAGVLRPNGAPVVTGGTGGPAEALRDGTVRHGVDWVLRRDGADPVVGVPVDWTATPRVDRGGVSGAVVTVRDMTERQRAEQQIHGLNRDLQALNRDLERRVAERTQELESANQELEAFSYSVSHDLRAPLRVTDGFSQALLEDAGDTLDETGKEYLMRIREGSQRMAQLIDDLLQLSRLTRTEMKHVQVDLSALVREILADLRSEEPDREVATVVASDVVVMGDKVLLRAVVDNLVRNAWKFTCGRAVATIEFGAVDAADAPPDMIGCFVRDDGAGFDPKYVDKLFQPFSRLHSSSEFEGTGIGLATVDRVVRRHGGSVEAEGVPDGGATFRLLLPKNGT